MDPIIDWYYLLAAATRTVATSRWPQNWRRFKFLLLFLIVWPVLKAIAVPCLLLDHLLYPGFKKVQIREPLFIVGNLRTGSTLLYRTLALDTENVACFRMIDTFLPAITMKRAAAWLGRLDTALGGPGARWVRRFDETFLADWSRIHDTGFLKPEEDELALLLHLASGSMFELFPSVSRFRRLLFVDSEMGGSEQRKVMGYYENLVRRHLHHLGPHKRFVSKNPLFSGKLECLARTFPDARFICLVRSPASTVPSTASLFHFLWHESGALAPGTLDMDTVLELCDHFYRHPRLVLAELGPERAVTVRFDDLVADPSGTIRGIWRHFDLPITPGLELVLQESGERQRSWKSEHRYKGCIWGVSEQDLYHRFKDVYLAYDFPAP